MSVRKFEAVAAARKLHELKTALAFLNGQDAELKDIVKRYLADQKKFELIEDGELLCTWKRHTRTIFDTETFAREHPRLYRQYTRGQPYSQFCVK